MGQKNEMFTFNKQGIDNLTKRGTY